MPKVVNSIVTNIRLIKLSAQSLHDAGQFKGQTCL